MNSILNKANSVSEYGKQLSQLEGFDFFVKKPKSISGLIDNLARHKVLKALDGLRFGRLQLDFDQQTFVFGDQLSSLQAKIIVKDTRAFNKLAFEGNVGVAEAYIVGYWETDDLVQVMRILAKNIQVLTQLDQSKQFVSAQVSRLLHWVNQNSLQGSKRNISAHYDLGNDFFALMLDSTMMYSSAIFQQTDQPLEQASLNKLDVICQKLALKETDNLLEIGTGWGGMAIYAAQHYGCKVTTTTISKQQFEYTLAKVKQLNLDNQITVLFKDYRELEGRFDKLVSIEMIEAVGHEHQAEYFRRCSALLKENGLMLIQAITIPDQRYQTSLKSVDFIQKYIFPGGRLPCNQMISNHLAQQTDLQIVDQHDIGLDYARTLSHWRTRFYQNIESVKQQGFDDYFCRLWDYYLCYCEGAFEERAISTVQYVMAKPYARFKR